MNLHSRSFCVLLYKHVENAPNPLQPAFASSRCSQVGTTRIVLFVRSKTDKNETKMGDDGDYAIEVADAGASATIPMEAGQIKKGG